MDLDICRVCFHKDDLVDLFEKSTEINLSSKLNRICNVNVTEGDNLPSFLCSKCASKVTSFYEFKKIVEVRDKYLNLMIVDGGDKMILPEIVESTDDTTSIHVENFDEKNENDENRVKDIENMKINLQSKSSSREKPQIQCSTCGKLVSSKYRLKCHMRIHTGEKPYECSVCCKTFSGSYILKLHERVHTGEKPLQCTVCNKKFAQSAGLVSHMRLHTGESPYKCHMCPKQFKTNSHLKYHIRLHTGEKNFSCQTCNKAFVTKSDLSQHERTHTAERSHVCTICGIRLKRAYHLERHMIVHTGIKNFRCETCGLSFSQRYDLNRHTKGHKHKETSLRKEEIQ